MIQDIKIQRAVSRILQRAERQLDDEKVVGTFVDVGILPRLDNRNNQVMYGRRGTGKTHVFRALAAELTRQSADNVVVYLDARTLGSSKQFSDPDAPLAGKCLALFRDIMTPVHNGLLEFIVEHPERNQSQVLELLGEATDALVEPWKVLRERARQTTTHVRSSSGAKIGVELGSSGARGAAKVASEGQTASNMERTFEVETEDKIIFPSLHSTLSEALEKADVTCWLLLDEWSSIPLDLQPYLAEFLKRTVVPINRFIVKIAALEYRSEFYEGTRRLGLELGADISTAPDLDDYYVYDRNPERVAKSFSDILYQHLRVSLDGGELGDTYSVRSGDDFVRKFFTQRKIYAELARSSEGVVRDLINIFTKAFFHAHRIGREMIARKSIQIGAQEWFEEDKATGLDEPMAQLLRRIVDQVIGKRKARSFMVPRELEQHALLRRLIDARVLHLMQRGYADKDNPGVRYNIYSVDYGTYVDLLGTTNEPDQALLVGEMGDYEAEPSDDIVVPFDDKRSIRRIVLTVDDLNAPTT